MKDFNLTNAEIHIIMDLCIPIFSTPNYDDFMKFAREIEKKIKEKNDYIFNNY